MPDYFDDEGNNISKNAWKKLQKRKKSAAKKAAKPAPQKKKTKDEELDPTKYFENRCDMVNNRTSAGEECYPHKFEVTISIPEFKNRYDSLKSGEKAEGVTQSIAGRINSVRSSSKKLFFYDVNADGARVQVMASARAAESVEAFMKQHEHVKRGDIIGVTGTPCRSKTGELTLFATETKLLSPCLHNLPSEKYPIASQEIRYRQRYLDLIITPKTREIFYTRSKIVNYVRRYLDSHGFLEVETPILNQVPSGAAARPFLTNHNELKLPMYLRIAPELYLKMLIVGGLDRVYEIGRLFRNEGIDLTHNPEFTTCEFYWAYKDYNDLMNVTEEMISEMVFHIKGSYEVEYTKVHDDGTKEECVLNFARPWPRYDMITEIEKRGNMSIPTPYESPETEEFLKEKLESLGIAVPHPATSRMLDKLVEHYLEPECQNPAFIINHPQIMSPLAKYHRSRPGLTERFECFVAGKEICNAYTELNNPIVQRALFAQQASVADKDDEAMVLDENFCTSIEHGLPPTAGWGMGIDRLTMFLTNSNNIREVILFPQMNPQSEEERANLQEKSQQHAWWNKKDETQI